MKQHRNVILTGISASIPFDMIELASFRKFLDAAIAFVRGCDSAYGRIKAAHRDRIVVGT